MQLYKEIYKQDCARYGNPRRFIKVYLYLLRYLQSGTNPLFKRLYRFLFGKISTSRHLEISPEMELGGGIYLGHVYCITINKDAVIGKNCNIHKGVTIGQESRGKRKGVPTIGNRVWIGVGAVVVGDITIGNDVMIAPNSFVNTDIPDHSIVFGNPCIIKHRDNATDKYINNIIDE